jgi:DNA-directed RNA polymerase I subunit RPA12
MSVIGSLIFCTDCGNLLRESTGNADAILHCDVCGTRNKGE